MSEQAQTATPLDAIRRRLEHTRSLDEIREVISQDARSVCSADGVALILRDGRQCHYIEEDAISPLWKGQRFPMEACISGWVMTHGEIAVIDDVFADARIPHAVYRKTFVKSLVMVPSPRGKREAMGAVGAYWGTYRAMTPGQIACVEELAETIGAAIERVTFG